MNNFDKKLGKTMIKNAIFIFYNLNNLNYENLRFLNPAK